MEAVGTVILATQSAKNKNRGVHESKFSKEQGFSLNSVF